VICIVVPYRDREEHLAKFLPTMTEFIARERLKARIIVVEQTPANPFNRGQVKNIGFILSGMYEPKCVVFHDVDYLPIQADYSKPKTGWAHLVSTGAEVIRDPRGFDLRHDVQEFAGGAVAFTPKAFLAVNSYPNSYWGWGFEDEDMKRRAVVAGIRLEKRRGSFQVLPHENEGADMKDGQPVPSEAHIRNGIQLANRYPPDMPPAIWRDTSRLDTDGVRTIKVQAVARSALNQIAEKVTVHV